MAPWGAAYGGGVALHELGRTPPRSRRPAADDTVAAGNRFDGSENLAIRMAKISLIERGIIERGNMIIADEQRGGPRSRSRSSVPATFAERNRQKQGSGKRRRHRRRAKGTLTDNNPACARNARVLVNRSALAGKVFGLGDLLIDREDDTCAKMCHAGLIAKKRIGYSRLLAEAGGVQHGGLAEAWSSLAGRARENGIRGHTRPSARPHTAHATLASNNRTTTQGRGRHAPPGHRAQRQWGRRQAGEVHHRPRPRAFEASPQYLTPYERFVQQQQQARGRSSNRSHRPQSSGVREREEAAGKREHGRRPHTSSGDTVHRRCAACLGGRRSRPA